MYNVRPLHFHTTPRGNANKDFVKTRIIINSKVKFVTDAEATELRFRSDLTIRIYRHETLKRKFFTKCSDFTSIMTRLESLELK